MNKDIVRNCIALSSVHMLGDESMNMLYQHFGTLNGIFDRSLLELTEAGLTERRANLIKNSKPDYEEADKIIATCEKYRIDILPIESDKYPAKLAEIHSPPPYIYCAGNSDVLNMPSVGIVGARKSSRQAVEFAEKLGADLAEVGFNVVSGFALGVDIASHKGAASKGITSAVLGNGLLKVYPAANKKYMEKILEKGCFVSEFEPYAGPDGKNFPRRNRIISGLSLGIVVIEASKKSGSLITVRYAAEQGREVFAVPSFPTHINNATNDLIKNGAKLTESYYDIVEEFGHLALSGKTVDKSSDNIIDIECPYQKKLVELLSYEALSADELSMKDEAASGELLGALTELELYGYIYKDTDGKYRAAGGADG